MIMFTARGKLDLLLGFHRRRYIRLMPIYLGPKLKLHPDAVDTLRSFALARLGYI